MHTRNIAQCKDRQLIHFSRNVTNRIQCEGCGGQLLYTHEGESEFESTNNILTHHAPTKPPSRALEETYHTQYLPVPTALETVTRTTAQYRGQKSLSRLPPYVSFRQHPSGIEDLTCSHQHRHNTFLFVERRQVQRRVALGTHCVHGHARVNQRFDTLRHARQRRKMDWPQAARVWCVEIGLQRGRMITSPGGGRKGGRPRGRASSLYTPCLAA